MPPSPDCLRLPSADISEGGPKRNLGTEALSRAEPEDAMGRATRKSGNFVAASNRWSCRDAPAERPRPAPGQALSRSLVALDQNSTIIAVVELSQSSW